MGEATTAVVPQQLAQITMGEAGLQIRTLDDLWRFAKYVLASGFAPKGLDKPESIVVAIQMGYEVGLSPMQAIQNMAVINGRPCMWGDSVKALCSASPHCEYVSEWMEGDGDNLTAFCEAKRRGWPKPCVAQFSMKDAKTADLAKKPGPWQQYPRRMLQMRARGFALRDAFADVLKGIVTREEAADLPPIDVTHSADAQVAEMEAQAVRQIAELKEQKKVDRRAELLDAVKAHEELKGDGWNEWLAEYMDGVGLTHDSWEKWSATELTALLTALQSK